VTESSQNTPLVSVIMITYKHEAFIAEAIDGVLMQECDFEVELIIADDSSPDKTSLIVSKYIETHPKGHWIKYTRHKHNKGMMPNFIWALEQAKGKYIALCEGDDYWIDSSKLNIQIDFLENQADYSAIMHQLKLNFQDENQKSEKYNGSNFDRNCSVQDVLNFSLDGTASLVFRNSLLTTPLDMLLKFKNGDTFLFLLLALGGNIKYLSRTMGVYRKHDGGLTNNRLFSGYYYFIETRKFLSFADSYTNFNFSKIILESKVRLLRWTVDYNSIGLYKRIQINILKFYYRLCLSAHFRLGLNINKLLNW
jgi:glycosyltransferase involved in cell wall biosynthesis